MTITFPSPAAAASFLGSHPVLAVVLVLIAAVIVPAIWSRRPERRCAATMVLAQMVAAVVAVAQLGVVTVVAVILRGQPGRAATV